MKPQILLLDEPASDLDPQGKDDLLDLLARLDGTQIIAAHDLELIRTACERVIVLDSGRVVGQGPTDEVLRDRNLMVSHGLGVPFSLQCCQTCSDIITASHRHNGQVCPE